VKGFAASLRSVGVVAAVFDGTDVRGGAAFCVIEKLERRFFAKMTESAQDSQSSIL